MGKRTSEKGRQMKRLRRRAARQSIGGPMNRWLWSETLDRVWVWEVTPPRGSSWPVRCWHGLGRGGLVGASDSTGTQEIGN